jgi:two-component system response regulator RegX3
LLDVSLPGRSGLDVCRKVRATSQVPIIMVSARTTELDTVVALEVGADDYVTKPYRLHELLARMHALLRRSALITDETAASVLESDRLRLDPTSYEVRLRGEKVTMPLKQFQLLELLMSHPGRVLDRQAIVGHVWGPTYPGDTKTLDVHVKRLRSKIEDDPSRPTRITTVRGVGYRFESASRGPNPRPA